MASAFDQDDVRLVDLDLLFDLTPDVAETLDPVEAHLQPAVVQHLGDLGVLLAVLLEDQFSLETPVLILSPPPVLASLSLVLRLLARCRSQFPCRLGFSH